MGNIIISSPEKLQEKIDQIKKDGLDKLYILSDFDRSFTKCIVDGKRSSTSWAQFRNLGIFDEDYLKRSSEMFEYYRPIEVSNEISEVEKQVEMREWWKKHLSLVIEKGLSKETINDVIERGGITLREGSSDIFNFLKTKNIPLVFISSGLGDIISGVLKKEGVLSDNIKIISNFFDFDENRKSKSFDGELVINSQNKNEVFLVKMPVFDIIEGRKNIILVGDAIEDLKMLAGSGYDVAISIGFLNEEVEKNIDIFKKNFDVVVTDDGDMNYVTELLKKIGE